jgi:hypothetical protein
MHVKRPQPEAAVVPAGTLVEAAVVPVDILVEAVVPADTLVEAAVVPVDTLVEAAAVVPGVNQVGYSEVCNLTSLFPRADLHNLYLIKSLRKGLTSICTYCLSYIMKLS